MTVKKTHEGSIRPAERHAEEKPQEITNGVQPELQELAYQLWIERGSPLGSPEIDWFKAEARIQAELAARASAPTRQAYRAAAGIAKKP